MSASRLARAALLASSLAVPVSVLPARADAPDPVRAEAAGALAEALRARILASPSATAVLEAWCAERGLAAEPRLVARRVPAPDKPLAEAQRARLAIGPDEPVRYRRVRLTCGAHVLSEADNWYVPARLTPEMNRVLDTSEAPFGRVVRPLAPTRRNLAVRPLRDASSGRPAPGEPLFSVEAVLSTEAGLPFCEVAETYLGAALGDAAEAR